MTMLVNFRINLTPVIKKGLILKLTCIIASENSTTKLKTKTNSYFSSN